MVRGAALAAAVLLEAVAFATVLRTRHGYTSAQHLLVVLAVGVGVALGASIIAGAATAMAHRRPRSLWAATTTLSTLGVVLALFIAAAAGSRIVLALHTSPEQSAASDPAARADFQRWQATVVPIVVRATNAMRAGRAFVHGFPGTAITELRDRVDRPQRTFGQLARSLAADSPRLPQRPALRRLTSKLKTALALAQRAQSSYTLAIRLASHTSSTRPSRATRIRLLVDRGNTRAESSMATMYTFSLDANKLGASLFVQKP